MKSFINLSVLSFLILLTACREKVEEEVHPYDPTKPVELKNFYPDTGRYLDKVILTGSNLETDPAKIKVYFNKKKAAVVGSNGEKMYVVVPRLPGEICDISVVIGKDSLVYDSKFSYESSVTVTTVAGNGRPDDIVGGPLSQTVLRPRFICVDKEDNIFGVSRSANEEFALFQINEQNDELIVLGKGYVANVPAADTESGVITYPTETTPGSFITLDPAESFGPRIRDIKWKDPSNIPDKGWKSCMAVNPEDGCLYIRYYMGHIVKMNLKTYEGEVIAMTPTGENWGITFRPNEPNILYFAMCGAAGDVSNSICTMDVSAEDPGKTFKIVSSNIISGGHRDGPLEVAQFNNPYQLFCDEDGNIYVADNYNNCIRRIRGSDNVVETVVGIPGVAGWKDGNSDEALFDSPTGIGISSDGSVYVADWNNARVRKLSIN